MAPDILGAAFIYILTRDFYPEGVIILEGEPVRDFYPEGILIFYPGRFFILIMARGHHQSKWYSVR